MHKDSNYKVAKWKEIAKIAKILHLNKEDVIKKWKSLRDAFLDIKASNPKAGMA